MFDALHSAPRHRRGPRLAALLVIFAFVAAACSSQATITSVSGVPDPRTDTIVSSTSASALGPTDDELNTIAIAERFGPSTASLAVTIAGERTLPDGTAAPAGQGSGSGFLIEANDTRFVVTNFHVVQSTLRNGTSEMIAGAAIAATFPGIDDDIPLRVVGVNPSFDLALLEPADDDRPLPNAVPIPIGDSDAVVKGQKTIAIGNPFGLGSTLTTGHVSSTERFVPSIGQVSIPMIQTDAAINPGNSGGALLNSSGELIGVNTAIFNPSARSFAGIGFAVPSNLLLEALANLELGGVSTIADTRPQLGANLATLSLLPEPIRVEAGLPSEGVAVVGVLPGGPAEAAGLRVPEFVDIGGVPIPVAPDVIVALDGEHIDTANDLAMSILYNTEIGQEVIVTVLRDGGEQDVPVVLTGGR